MERSTPLPAEEHLPRTATGASASATAAPSIGESSVRDSGVVEADSRGGVFTRTRQRTRREDGSDPAHQAAPLGENASQTATHQVQAQPTDPEPNGPSGTGKLTLFYQSSMSSAYKKEEKVIRSIIDKNCTPTNQNDELKLVIYYKSPTVSSLVLKNNLSHVPSLLRSTNVVYKFKCSTGDCVHYPNRTYIGHTVTTMSRRITMHLQDGAPLRHMHQEQGIALTREMMVANTTIIARCPKRHKLQAMEAVFIRDSDPLINRQMNLRGSLTLFDAAPLRARV